MSTIVAVSDGVAGEVRRWYPNSNVQVIPNGVDTSVFFPDEERKRYRSTDRDRTVILFVGGDWFRKGLPELVGSLAYLPESYVLWVAGDGNADELLDSSIADRSVRKRIRFLGRRSDVPQLMQEADIFVLPSSYEAAPLVGFEAAASALPIVTTEVHGLADFVVTHGAGVVTPREPESIAEAVQAASADAEMGARGRAGALRQTWDVSAELTSDVWEALSS